MHTSISSSQTPARLARLRRRSQRLWALLHAQALLAGPAAAGSAGSAEDDYRRLAGTHSGGYQGRMP
jgi:hypothetical protein